MSEQFVSRRSVLTGIGAFIASPVVAAPETSVIPRLRSSAVVQPVVPETEAMIAAAQLGGRVAYAVADAMTGQLLESRAHLMAMPPASVTKAVTAHYALSRLGADYRYRTRLIATGPVEEGQIRGDLVLQSSADPTLDSDDLGEMAEALKAAGIRGVDGRFLVVTPNIPETSLIDPTQPDQVSYNPGVGGLNLNFNRVHFEWKKAGSRYDVTMQARALEYSPDCRTAQMEIVDRAGPVYSYDNADGIERWTVARGALGSHGARWLPIRRPMDYALDALDRIMKANGVLLPKAVRTAAAPDGAVIYQAASRPLSEILQQMLKYSTNLTAEVVGQTASIADGGGVVSLRASAQRMSDWLRDGSSARRPGFVDHSGLSDRNDVSAHDMVAGLRIAGLRGSLPGLMKPWYLRNAQGGPDKSNATRIAAKTGTLNFVSCLGGFVLPPSGRPLVFAIFTADEDRRGKIPREQRERPPGAKSWAKRSRGLQDGLLTRWTQLYV